MSEFCPDGYVPAQMAIVRAAEYWYPERFAALERAAAPQSETKPDSGVDGLARAFSQPPGIPDVLQQEFQDIVNQTVHELRNLLHQGKLKAYFFGDQGCHSPSSEFWATAQANGVIELGTYWPFGMPTRWNESRPSYPLFLLRSELDVLLSEQPAKKRQFPEAKMPELVEALRKLDDLPDRGTQFQTLCNMPEFHEFTITDARFRKAVKEAGPRRAGRKPRRK